MLYQNVKFIGLMVVWLLVGACRSSADEVVINTEFCKTNPKVSGGQPVIADVSFTSPSALRITGENLATNNSVSKVTLSCQTDNCQGQWQLGVIDKVVGNNKSALTVQIPDSLRQDIIAKQYFGAYQLVVANDCNSDKIPLLLKPIYIDRTELANAKGLVFKELLRTRALVGRRDIAITPQQTGIVYAEVPTPSNGLTYLEAVEQCRTVGAHLCSLDETREIMFEKGLASLQDSSIHIPDISYYWVNNSSCGYYQIKDLFPDDNAIIPDNSAAYKSIFMLAKISAKAITNPTNVCYDCLQYTCAELGTNIDDKDNVPYGTMCCR